MTWTNRWPVKSLRRLALGLAVVALSVAATGRADEADRAAEANMKLEARAVDRAEKLRDRCQEEAEKIASALSKSSSTTGSRQAEMKKFQEGYQAAYNYYAAFVNSSNQMKKIVSQTEQVNRAASDSNAALAEEEKKLLALYQERDAMLKQMADAEATYLSVMKEEIKNPIDLELAAQESSAKPK